MASVSNAFSKKNHAEWIQFLKYNRLRVFFHTFVAVNTYIFVAVFDDLSCVWWICVTFVACSKGQHAEWDCNFSIKLTRIILEVQLIIFHLKTTWFSKQNEKLPTYLLPTCTIFFFKSLYFIFCKTSVYDKAIFRIKCLFATLHIF